MGLFRKFKKKDSNKDGKVTKAEKEVFRSEKVADNKTVVGRSKHEVVQTKENEQVSYKKSGSDSEQQAKVKNKTTGDVKRAETTNKGGTYKTYGKKSEKAQSFRDAFKSARKAWKGGGSATFTWNGLKYSVKHKGE